jgi:uncharacterized membrane protein
MLLLAEGIPALPDLTHPQELLNFGRQILEFKQWLLWLLVGLGLVLAALYFSYHHRREVDSNSWLDRLMTGYGQLVRGLFHALLVVSILVGGFFFSSTLANRYHHWEQDKISRSADTVAGERVEQPAPDRSLFAPKCVSSRCQTHSTNRSGNVALNLSIGVC